MEGLDPSSILLHRDVNGSPCRGALRRLAAATTVPGPIVAIAADRLVRRHSADTGATWDYAMHAAPVLADLRIGGRPRKVLSGAEELLFLRDRLRAV